MSNSLPEPVRLLRMALRHQQDVVLCRRRARAISGALGFEPAEQVRIATAISEIARNAVDYAKDGMVDFAVEPGASKFVATVTDLGGGIPNLDEILAGRFKSTTSAGRGIVGAKRLMDRVEITSNEKGVAVRLEKMLPARGGRSWSPAELRKVAETIGADHALDSLEELAVQNRELARALEDVQSQKDELERRSEELHRMSIELAETNRGVLALYDELDSLHRLGRLIAAQLDLDSLLQAVIDATTDLSGAEFGAFFHCLAADGRFHCQAVAGPLRDLHLHFQRVDVPQLFGQDAVPSDVIRSADLNQIEGSHILGAELGFRSYLAVPVQDEAGSLRGAMIFGHRTPAFFTERNERILGALAAEAAVGMENARRYTSVQAASAAKDHFLATLSHELRTPLNPVFIMLSQLKSDPRLPEDVHRDLRMMQRNLDLEARLVDDLLDMTRIVKGKIVLREEILDVHELLLSSCETCAPNSHGKGLAVSTRLQADHPFVRGDATRLQQVFWNLLNNAIKFTHGGGAISIRTSNPADEAVIRIELEDNGRGIEAAMLQRIFHPFEQGRISGAPEFGGLGLGLSICKAIIETHGGQISALSDGSGRGSTFVVELPIVEGGQAAPEKPPHALEVSPQPTLAGLRILLVDDHADTLTTLQRILSRRGHTVVPAANAAAALAIAAREPFDFMISDIGLPDRSGLELMRELQELYGLRGIALSGYGTEADIAQSRAAGFYGHLTKPINVASLDLLLTEASARKGA